ncbi:MAG: hypothetical protein KDE48_02575 [Anaerolineales bacterium]|nr:hypothetical protein [Anaerolineales bacterium]
MPRQNRTQKSDLIIRALLLALAFLLIFVGGATLYFYSEPIVKWLSVIVIFFSLVLLFVSLFSLKPIRSEIRNDISQIPSSSETPSTTNQSPEINSSDNVFSQNTQVIQIADFQYSLIDPENDTLLDLFFESSNNINQSAAQPLVEVGSQSQTPQEKYAENVEYLGLERSISGDSIRKEVENQLIVFIKMKNQEFEGKFSFEIQIRQGSLVVTVIAFIFLAVPATASFVANLRDATDTFILIRNVTYEILSRTANRYERQTGNSTVQVRTDHYHSPNLQGLSQAIRTQPQNTQVSDAILSPRSDGVINRPIKSLNRLASCMTFIFFLLCFIMIVGGIYFSLNLPSNFAVCQLFDCNNALIEDIPAEIIPTETIELPSPAILQKGTTIRQLEPGEVDRLTFFGSPNDYYDLVVFPFGNNINEEDLVVRIYDPQGNTIELENDTGLSFAEGIFGLKPPISGEYEIEIWNQFFKEGSYGLVFLDGEIKKSDSNQLYRKGPFQDFISSSQKKYWFVPGVNNQTFSAIIDPFGANQRYTDLSIQIRDPNGNLLLDMDQTGSGESEKIEEIQLDIEGYYTIWIENKNPIDGEFVISTN